MEPAFARGDILFLYHPPVQQPIDIGEITVYKLPNTDIPIVHRVIDHHLDVGLETEKILTKGDNNPGDDIVLYRGPKWLRRDQIVGKVIGYIPYAGYITILMVCALFEVMAVTLTLTHTSQNDHPNIKYAGIALMAAFVMLKRE